MIFYDDKTIFHRILVFANFRAFLNLFLVLH